MDPLKLHPSVIRLAELELDGECIGVIDALNLSRQMGGDRLYVPVELTPDHPLMKVAGERVARIICYHMPSTMLEPVTYRLAIKPARDCEIFEKFTNGSTFEELKAQYNLSVRHIRNIVRQQEQSPCH